MPEYGCRHLEKRSSLISVGEREIYYWTERSDAIPLPISQMIRIDKIYFRTARRTAHAWPGQRDPPHRRDCYERREHANSRIKPAHKRH